MKRRELIVIGGGLAGYAAAIRARQLGRGLLIFASKNDRIRVSVDPVF